MSLAVVASVVSAVATALLVATTRRSRRQEWVWKPIAATGFVIAGVAWGAADHRFGAIILAGLIASWFGDVLLLPRGKRWFLAGLVAFLLGHVAYAVAFGLRGVAWPASAIGVAGVGAVTAVVARWLLPHVEAAMKIPVLAYMTVISAMVALAIGTAVRHGNPWLVVGAVAFYASDLAVARDRFVAAGWSNRAWGMPLYIGAQLVLAWCAGRP